MPIISFRGFRKEYKGLTAVKDLNLDIEKGEFFGLLGPNGAGKTTTINALIGLLNITKGSITVKGYDSVKNYKKTHRLIGVAPQEEDLDFWWLSVRNILIYRAGYFGIPRKAAGERADEMLRLMDLWEKKDSQVRELSGGMKRRLLLARAIMHDPEIIVMDEPTAGADVELRHKLWKYIKLLNRKGKTIILTTHYLEEAESLCDRVAIMNMGEILAVGKPEDLKKGSRHEAVEIEVDSTARARKTLSKFGKASASGNEITLTLKDADKHVPAIIKALVKSNIRIRSMSIRRSSLEDVYLSLVNGGKP